MSEFVLFVIKPLVLLIKREQPGLGDESLIEVVEQLGEFDSFEEAMEELLSYAPREDGTHLAVWSDGDFVVDGRGGGL